MRAPVLVAVVLLAGCLETAQEAPSGDLTLPSLPTLPDPIPVPEPTPEPVPERVTPPVPPTPPMETLHRDKREGDGDRALVVVPAGFSALQFVVEANASWSGEVRLVAPDGATKAVCDGEPCVRLVGEAIAGDWHIEYDAGVPGEVGVSVYAVPASDATQHLLYQRTRDLGGAFDGRVDQLRVQPGYDRLVLKARFTDPDAAGDAQVALLDAAGRVVLSCRPAADPCATDAPLPQEGLWGVQHQGEGAGRVDVTVWGLSAAHVPVESNYTALRASYSYLDANATVGFYVREGHQRMGLNVGFRRATDATATGDPVVVLVRDPAGQVVARCQLGTSMESCPSQLPAAAGLWRVAFVGPDEDTTADVSAFVFAPGEPEETRPAPTPTPWQPWEGRVYEATRSMGPKWYDHIPLLTTTGHLTGTIRVQGEGTVYIFDPGRETRWTCTATCAVDLQITWAGVWRVAYVGDKGASASVALDLAAEDLTRGGDGHMFTAYEEQRFAGEEAGIVQGIAMPPGWSRMHVWINQTTQDMGGTVTLRQPTGASSSCAATCAFDVEAAAGLFEIAYETSVTARVTVRVS